MGESNEDYISNPEDLSFATRMLQVTEEEPLRSSNDVKRKTPLSTLQPMMRNGSQLKQAGNFIVADGSGDLPDLIKGSSASVSPQKSVSNAKARWQRLSNVIRGINLMKKSEVKTILNAEDVISEIGKSPARVSHRQASSQGDAGQALNQV